MARKKGTVYVCQQCGNDFPKWSGQCGSCGSWNSLVETAVVETKGGGGGAKGSGKVYKWAEVKGNVGERLEVGSGEMGQVLGGGMVKGSVVLMAGEPGIGKSTILSQLTLYFASKHGKVLYVCGEESPDQVKLRLERLSNHKKTSDKAKENVLLMPEIDTDRVVATMEEEKPVLTIVDSIQTLSTSDLSGMAGSVGQVRESGNRIMNLAKGLQLSTFLVGHVTKQGSLAGPKVLEHMVDCVLYLTGERSGSLRLLRAVKNRFGPVDEVGVFEMKDAGLSEVSNPSSVFLSETQVGVSGSCVGVMMEGSRPILTEIQALVTETSAAMPRRVATGVRLSRLQVLCAVLQKRCGIRLGDKDVYVSVAGGFSVEEPAVDLAICLAIASSVGEKSLPARTAVFGEVGLLGELRPVGFGDKRIREAKKLGYKEVITPKEYKDLGSLMKSVFGGVVKRNKN